MPNLKELLGLHDKYKPHREPCKNDKNNGEFKAENKEEPLCFISN